jgi:hypothetical protein
MGGAAPIPVSELLSYVTYHKIDNDSDRYRLEYLIRAMDMEMMNLWNKKD